jgi:hypothetical protein
MNKRARVARAGILTIAVSTAAVWGSAAQTGQMPPPPVVYGPPGVPDAPRPAPALPATPAPPSLAASDAGTHCTAYLGTAADAQTMICGLDQPQPLGGVCHCAFPPVPPPGILPSPPAVGHVTR